MTMLKQEMEKYILQIDKIQGKKKVMMILKGSKIEICSEGKKLIYDGKSIA